jgi:hypothetical protein
MYPQQGPPRAGGLVGVDEEVVEALQPVVRDPLDEQARVRHPRPAPHHRARREREVGRGGGGHGAGRVVAVLDAGEVDVGVAGRGGADGDGLSAGVIGAAAAGEDGRGDRARQHQVDAGPAQHGARGDDGPVAEVAGPVGGLGRAVVGQLQAAAVEAAAAAPPVADDEDEVEEVPAREGVDQARGRAEVEAPETPAALEVLPTAAPPATGGGGGGGTGIADSTGTGGKALVLGGFYLCGAARGCRYHV